ncbi:MAG TPA: type II toxin-antitoxin system HicB family antitoxin [bacterium]|nr:type II toxin-antitoxin system HicB family antitoxin [bacterium]HQO35232.1 type II toxin-antitoxin system HicB family antitoxin [bacterium]HQP99602.1 type II toxin-antitoxin system HicB family antitoxin [bacterium]
MIQDYLNAALKEAKYKTLDNGEWFAEIPGFQGVWANGRTVEECRSELIEVLEEWLILKIRDGDEIPTVEGIEIGVKHEEVA